MMFRARWEKEGIEGSFPSLERLAPPPSCTRAFGSFRNTFLRVGFRKLGDWQVVYPRVIPSCHTHKLAIHSRHLQHPRLCWHRVCNEHTSTRTDLNSVLLHALLCCCPFNATGDDWRASARIQWAAGPYPFGTPQEHCRLRGRQSPHCLHHSRIR